MRGTLKWAAGVTVCMLVTMGFSEDASARTRLNFYYSPYFAPAYPFYYGEPIYVPRQRRHFYSYQEVPPAWAYSDPYEAEAYFEPRYDPDYAPQPKSQAAPQAKPAKKQAAIKKPAVKPSKKTPAVMSCGKATEVVSEFGFADVKTIDCKGQVYAFNAMRDGKKFSIKLNAVNGELTEVKKL